MKAEKRFRKNKAILPLFISLIIILSFTIFVSIYVITNNSSNEQNLNENSNPLKLGNLLQYQNVNPNLDLEDLIFYHTSHTTSSNSKSSGSSSSSDDVNEEINLGNPTEESTTNLNTEEPETNSPDNSDSVDNIQTSDDKKSKLIDDENDGFIDVIVMLKDDEVSDKMLGIAIDSPVEKKLSIIKSKVKTKQDKVLSTLDSSEFRIKHRYKTVSGFAGKITQEAWDKLEQDPNVESIYEDEMVYATLLESVPLINADDIHDLGITGEGTVVCVVDTGIDYTHPDLGSCLGDGCKVIDGYDFVNNDTDPMDDYNPYGHGTHVAGIVAANGVFKGVAPDAELVAVKVLNNWGSGFFSDVAAGIDWCNDKKSEYNVVVTTMSLGDNKEYNGANCLPKTAIEAAINRAHDLDIAVTVASGNNAYSNGISYPACSPNAISVGAVYDADVGRRTWCIRPWCTEACTDVTTFANKIVCFTNTGPLLDLLAPGSIITSTKLGGGSIGMSGTSMATPFVAGAIALAKQYIPSASPDQIEYVLKKSGIQITDPDNNLSFSRIDLLAAANYSECSSSSDCGTNHYVGDSSCQDDDVWQNYTTYTCNLNILCSDSTAPKLKEDCGEDYCEDWQDNYCKEGGVYRKRVCHENGCLSGVCYDNEYVEEEIVEECEYGCGEGECYTKGCKTICNFGKCYEYCG